MATVVAPDAAAELAQAFGEVSETIILTVGGKPREVKVTPLRLRQFARVLQCLKRMRAAGELEAKTLEDVAGAADAEEAAKRFDIVNMFLGGSEEIVNILQIAVEKQVKAEHVDGLDLADGARLASAVFAVNLDFFYQNRETSQAALAPALQAVEKVVDEGVESLGLMPPTDSSEQATG